MDTSRREFLATVGALVAMAVTPPAGARQVRGLEGPGKMARQDGSLSASLRVSHMSGGQAGKSQTRASLGPPFGRWVRPSPNPILAPRGEGFESAGVFNPAAIAENHDIALLYRAQDRGGISRIGYAKSSDGIHFTRRPEPVFTPETDYERGGGVEDPRLVKIGDLYYMTYTGYNGNTAQLCLATSHDLLHWDRQGVILPAYKGKWNVGWTKSGAILDRKVQDKYWMYYLADARDHTHQMGIAYSSDLRQWTEALDNPVLPARPGRFDSQVVEPGPPPVVTLDGILLLYNGADDKFVYSTGWAIFDSSDPTRLLARSEAPIFHPERPWEKVGQVPNVVFVEGMVRRHDNWLFYYGSADKYVGVAGAHVPILIAK